MAQVYAVLHNGRGEFMVAFKNSLGYFFHNHGHGGVIVPAGARLHGGGSWALPGGEHEVLDPVQGAINEFAEETGVRLDARQANPTILRGRGFYGVYFNLGDEFQTYFDLAKANTAVGRLAAAAVIAGTYGARQYDDLMDAFQGCPADNELNEVYQWGLKEHIQEINLLVEDPHTDWHYEILANLALEVYGVIVKDEQGQLAGIGSGLAVEPGPQYIISGFAEDPDKLLLQGNYSIVTRRRTYRGIHLVNADGEIAVFRGA